MKKLLGAAAAASALLGMSGMVSTAHAEVAFSGNVALATDYVFRGLSQTDGPAIQGGFDATSDIFYAGVWGSNVNFENGIETDIYAGFKPTLGPIAADFGVVGYLYPGVDASPESNYWEIYGKGSIAPAEGASLGAAVYYSPEFFGETGDGWYTEVNGSFAASDVLSFSGAVGYQYVELSDFDATTAAVEDNYWSWNVGGTFSAQGFGFDLRYYGSEIEDSDPALGEIAGDRFVFAIKRAL